MDTTAPRARRAWQWLLDRPTPTGPPPRRIVSLIWFLFVLAAVMLLETGTISPGPVLDVLDILMLAAIVIGLTVVVLMIWLARRDQGPTGRPEEPDEAEPDKDLPHMFAQNLAEFRENLAPLDEAARGYRTQLIADGWSEDAAENMALAFYATQMNMLNKAIEGAADA
ncbi:hypothetical protein [Actinomadura sp. WMMA1423]|uniref:hypothetical protein n=1 Tax=Actinomadura sp. WMMA1423 TaxID=2591108 RepID=UPI001146F7E8|nr:hypothetical protein [Actinomadura sp. WMMA1423]